MIWWMRHGESTWNVAGREQGTTVHPPLTEHGRHQVRQACAHLASLDLHRIVSSPAVRAQQSAQIVAAELGLDVTVDDRLLELGIGENPAGIFDRVVDFAQEIAADDRVLAVSHGDTMGIAIQALSGRRVTRSIGNAEVHQAG